MAPTMGFGGTQRSVLHAKVLYIAPNLLFNWDRTPQFNLVGSNWTEETSILGVASFQPHLHGRCREPKSNQYNEPRNGAMLFNGYCQFSCGARVAT